MKKITIILTTIFLLFLPCTQTWAQADTTKNILHERVNEQEKKARVPYKVSVGAMASYFAIGFSSKFFFCKHTAFQTELLWKGVFSPYKDDYYNEIFLAAYVNLETNLNIIYQKKIKEKKNSELFCLVGGGTSFGYDFTVRGKFGLNTIVGLEYVFKKKTLAIQIDFRPGYGMLFTFDGSDVKESFSSHKTPWHHYDWLIGFTLRYVFKKK